MENSPMLTTVYPTEGITEVGTSKVITSVPPRGGLPRIQLPGRVIIPSEWSIAEGGDDPEALRSTVMSKIDTIITRLLTTHDTVCVTSRGSVIVENRPKGMYFAYVIVSFAGLNLRNAVTTALSPEDFIQQKVA